MIFNKFVAHDAVLDKVCRVGRARNSVFDRHSISPPDLFVAAIGIIFANFLLCILIMELHFTIDIRRTIVDAGGMLGVANAFLYSGPTGPLPSGIDAAYPPAAHALMNTFMDQCFTYDTRGVAAELIAADGNQSGGMDAYSAKSIAAVLACRP
jgi:hypothetical protein